MRNHRLKALVFLSKQQNTRRSCIDCINASAVRFNQWHRIPKNSTRRQQGCANRLMLKPFKRKDLRLQVIERFVAGAMRPVSNYFDHLFSFLHWFP